MADVPKPGTRWLARRGRHAGNEVEVAKATGHAVTLKPLGGGEAWGKGKTDDSRVLHLNLDAFLAQYKLKEATNGTNGTNGYRRVAVPKAPPPIVPPTVKPASGHITSGGTNLNIEVLTITPDMARAWLDRGGKNRKLGERRVLKLVGIINRGEWRLTGETIKLDADGTVRDGQHRLEAIARAGMPVQSVVVRNIEESAFDAIDTGASRTIADVLSIHGYGNRISLAAQARALLIIERFGRYAVRGRAEAVQTVSAANALAYVRAHPEVEEALRIAYQVKSAGLMGGAAMWGAAFTLFLRIDPAALEEFADKLATGADLTADSPILRLRNRSIADKSQRGDNTESGREMLMAVIIKAWNHWRRGEQIKQLTWKGQSDKNPEPFPVPI